jgi:hypothetical protein
MGFSMPVSVVAMATESTEDTNQKALNQIFILMTIAEHSQTSNALSKIIE